MSFTKFTIFFTNLYSFKLLHISVVAIWYCRWCRNLNTHFLTNIFWMDNLWANYLYLT